MSYAPGDMSSASHTTSLQGIWADILHPGSRSQNHLLPAIGRKEQALIVDEMSLLPESEAEYADFIKQFDDCSLPKSRWLHGSHLLVALWYVAEHGDDALPLVRLGILKYNESTGVRNTETAGYHETVTVFWVRMVHAFLRRKGDERPRHELAADLIAEYSFRKNLFREYYSFDLMTSKEARQRWVSPDLRPLP